MFLRRFVLRGGMGAAWMQAAGKVKETTGIVGLDVVPNAREVLISLYTRTLKEIQGVPEDECYRKAVESFTRHRLQVCQEEEDWEAIENRLGCGQVEELVEEAQDELKLIAKMIEGTFAPEAAAVGADRKGGDPWDKRPLTEDQGDIFDGIDREFAAKEGGGGENVKWETAEGYKPWTLGVDDEGSNLFDVGKEGEVGIEGIDDSRIDAHEKERIEEQKQLEKKEEELLVTLKGPNRAFGDLIAASGITEDMIDSLILLKDVRGIKGLPPLTEIEDRAIAKLNATSTRTEIERQKQEEIAKSRVRQVDEKGRAYGTGRRKCSIARVWVKPGDGKFIVNEKQFDAYFPILDHRAELLQPFNVTKTLGLWDVTCTVKAGGVSGQVGAIRLGISRALQNWEPGLRPYLKAAGYLTRDPRVVERKKPGKAKARKSFQWVKR